MFGVDNCILYLVRYNVSVSLNCAIDLQSIFGSCCKMTCPYFSFIDFCCGGLVRYSVQCFVLVCDVYVLFVTNFAYCICCWSEWRNCHCTLYVGWFNFSYLLIMKTYVQVRYILSYFKNRNSVLACSKISVIVPLSVSDGMKTNYFAVWLMYLIRRLFERQTGWLRSL
jgi:hypothetical protein